VALGIRYNVIIRVYPFFGRQSQQETQLSLTHRATRLEVSQGHQTWYHSICSHPKHGTAKSS